MANNNQKAPEEVAAISIPGAKTVPDSVIPRDDIKEEIARQLQEVEDLEESTLPPIPGMEDDDEPPQGSRTAQALALLHQSYGQVLDLQATYMAVAGFGEGSREAPSVDWTVGVPSADGTNKAVKVNFDLNKLSEDAKALVADELLADVASNLYMAINDVYQRSGDCLAMMAEDMKQQREAASHE